MIPVEIMESQNSRTRMTDGYSSQYSMVLFPSYQQNSDLSPRNSFNSQNYLGSWFFCINFFPFPVLRAFLSHQKSLLWQPLLEKLHPPTISSFIFPGKLHSVGMSRTGILNNRTNKEPCQTQSSNPAVVQGGFALNQISEAAEPQTALLNEMWCPTLPRFPSSNGRTRIQSIS